MVKELRKITNKPLFFCWALPHEVIDTAISQALVAPTSKDNVIFDGQSYPPSTTSMAYFKTISLLMGNVSLYIGEFNSGFTNGVKITEDQIYEFVRRFEQFSIYGWAMWRWSYLQDLNIPAFNLTQIIDGKIQPNICFNYFKDAIKKVTS